MNECVCDMGRGREVEESWCLRAQCEKNIKESAGGGRERGSGDKRSRGCVFKGEGVCVKRGSVAGEKEMEGGHLSLFSAVRDRREEGAASRT